jgi:hypothetical protein
VTDLHFFVENRGGERATVTLYVNGRRTDLSCNTSDVSNATCSDTRDSATVNAGDRVQVFVTDAQHGPAGWTAALNTSGTATNH